MTMMKTEAQEMSLRFQEAIRDLEQRGIMPLRVPSLEPTREALKRLRLQYPSDQKRVIVVAGTNGKGSMSKTLEALLQNAGQRTGLYTSPHLISYRERIRIEGRDITEEQFYRAWHAVASCTHDLLLSHFEMLTMMAAWLFFSGEVVVPIDFAIFEVGLGGSWDSTNAIPHGTAVICKLGFDHQEFLGDTMIEIAANKFGVVSQGASVIHLPLPEEVIDLKNKVAAKTASHWTEPESFQWSADTSESLPRFYLESRWGRAEISLPGARGAENMNLALTTFASLGFDPAKHLKALREVVWPARMQRIEFARARCPIFISGDHNIQGVESLLDLMRYYRYEKLHLIIGVGGKKDLDPMMDLFTQLPRSSYRLTTAQFRGRTREQYGKWVEEAEGFFEDPMMALEDVARTASERDLCLITGSLYLAGDVLQVLSRGP